MLKRFLNNKNIKYITIPVFIFAFIFIGIFIFNFSGITNLISNNFYAYINQDIKTGQVAGIKSKSLFNPPYPRIGQLYFQNAYRAGPDIWKNHSMVAVTYTYGGTARAIKYNNPNTLVLGASADIVATKGRGGIRDGFPEEWFLYEIDSQGDRAHIGGEDFWGGHIVNLTDECPKVNFGGSLQTASEYLAKALADEIDWDAFDGLYLDGWMDGLYYYVANNDLSVIDINYDEIPDGADKVSSKWKAGLENWISNLRKELPAGKVIIAHESSGKAGLNGNAFEFWTNNPSSNFDLARSIMSSAVAPQLNYANGHVGSFYKNDQKNISMTGPEFRADFTSAQVSEAFFGHDASMHRFTFMHDEYEGDLGYPTSGLKTINGLKVKYFDNGVIISNVSGSGKSIRAGDLEGGPYYRFLGNQEPAWNNGKKFSGASFQPLDGIMLFKEQIVLVTPIIIDNMEYNMTTVGQDPVDYSGSWTQSKSTVPCGSEHNCYGMSTDWGDRAPGYAYSPPGSGDIAEYKPKINIPGEYEIFEWHGSYKNETMATNVPYNIYINNNLIETKTIDQSKNQAGWNSLGVFDIKQGENISIKISNNANGYVVSDAIKFVNLASFIKEYDAPPPIPPKVLAADFNCDDKTDIQDFAILLSNWHKDTDDPSVTQTTRGKCTKPKSLDMINICK